MVAVLEKRPKGISLTARDTSRQKLVHVDEVPADATVGELVEGLVTGGMNLPRNDVEGRAMTYHLRLEREGRHLHASEVVGDVLQENDEVVLQPNIQAGSSSPQIRNPKLEIRNKCKIQKRKCSKRSGSARFGRWYFVFVICFGFRC